MTEASDNHFYSSSEEKSHSEALAGSNYADDPAAPEKR